MEMKGGTKGGVEEGGRGKGWEGGLEGGRRAEGGEVSRWTWRRLTLPS